MFRDFLIQKYLLPVVFAWALPNVVSAAPAITRDVTLPQALQLALEHSPVLGQERAAIQRQLGVRIVAKAAMLPTIDGLAGYSATDAGKVESFGPMATPLDQSWSAQLSVSYVVYNGGGRLANLKASEASQKAAEDQFRAAVNTVLLKVVHAYYDALLARDRITVQEEARTVLGEQLETARKRFAAGTGQQFAVLQAEVSLANANPPLINARSAYKLAVERLREAAGVDYPPGLDGSGIRLTSSWPDNSEAPSLDAALESARISRPELAAAQATIEMARQQLVIEHARMKPQVEANAGYGLQSRSFSDDLMEDPLHGWTAGFQVRIPILDLGQSRGRRIQAEAMISASEMAARETELRVQGEVRESWLAVEEAREILASSALVVVQAQEALRLARAGFDAGAGTQLEVLESRLALTQARLNELQAKHQYHTALASLRRAAGGQP